MKTIAAIHVAKKQLGLDDDTYRAALVRVTGKASTKDMSEAERKRVVEHFRQSGFKAKPAGTRKPLTGPFAAKLQALWIAGWNLGLVRNRDDAALLAFVKRQTGIDHTRFLRDGDDAYKAIEAMKKWLERAGVDWTVGQYDPDVTRLSGFKIAVAQYQKLWSDSDFTNRVYHITGRIPLTLLKESDWHPVMNTFGERIRAVSKPKEQAA